MRIGTYLPSEQLRPYIQSYLIVDCDKDVVNSMLPHTAPVMGFRFRGKTKYINGMEHTLPFAVVAGLRNTVQLMHDEAGTGNIIVVFKTAGAAAFFRQPLHVMYGEVLSLTEFDNYKALGEIEDRLCSAKNDLERILVVETFLLSRLGYYQDKPDNLIMKATQMIFDQKGVIRIKSLAKNLFTSQDAFEKRFRKFTGASPKQFSYIVRMNAVLESLQHDDLSQLAFNAGYYDQSHFNKDFKRFTGQTPTEYLKSRAWQNQ